MEKNNSKQIYRFIKTSSDELLNSIKNNKDKLIDAFTIYYGEKYRNTISEKINNTLFFTYISPYIIDLIEYSYNNIEKTNKNNYQDFKNLIDFYKTKKRRSKFYNNDIDVDENFKNIILTNIKEQDDASAFQITNIDENNNPIYAVFLGIGSDDKTVIHETNHVITNSLLGYIKYDNILETIEKIGITKSDHFETGAYLEELLNDRSTEDILKIFKNINGCITNSSILSINLYPLSFPLINKFYDKYKELLKEVRITDNHNLLFKEIDKEKFKEYEKYICDQTNDIEKLYSLKRKDIIKANKLINNLASNKPKENISEYISELKKQKRIIEILNIENSNIKQKKKNK